MHSAAVRIARSAPSQFVVSSCQLPALSCISIINERIGALLSAGGTQVTVTEEPTSSVLGAYGSEGLLAAMIWTSGE